MMEVRTGRCKLLYIKLMFKEISTFITPENGYFGKTGFLDLSFPHHPPPPADFDNSGEHSALLSRHRLSTAFKMLLKAMHKTKNAFAVDFLLHFGDVSVTGQNSAE